MRKLTLRLTVAIFTFVCGAIAVTCGLIYQRSLSQTNSFAQADNYRLLSFVTKVTDWDNFVVPAQSIHVEIAEFFPDGDKKEKWSEQKRVPFQTSDFEREGKKIKQVQYIYDFTEKSPTGYVEGPPVTYSYDGKGRLMKEHVYTVYGTVSIETTYIYDTSGRLIEELARKTEDGKTLNRKIYRHNPETSYVEVEEYDWDNRLRNKIGYIIKSKERVIELIAPDAPFRGKQIISFDDKGNILEAVVWLSEGTRGKEIYSYEFDSRGNWIKQLRSEQIIENGRIITKPRSVTYRRIKYY